MHIWGIFMCDVTLMKKLKDLFLSFTLVDFIKIGRWAFFIDIVLYKYAIHLRPTFAPQKALHRVPNYASFTIFDPRFLYLESWKFWGDQVGILLSWNLGILVSCFGIFVRNLHSPFWNLKSELWDSLGNFLSLFQFLLKFCTI